MSETDQLMSKKESVKKPKMFSRHRDPNGEQAPLSSDVIKLSNLSAHDRVIEGLKMLRSQRTQKTKSPCFCSGTHRTLLGTQTTSTDGKTAQQLHKEELYEKKMELLRQKVYGHDLRKQRDGNMSPARGEDLNRNSASPAHKGVFSKGKVDRAAFLYVWSRLPVTVPTGKHLHSTPGPGAYTSALHFLGK